MINPTLLAGQVHGAIAQGIGPALAEAMTYSPDGQPLTGSLLDYAIPSADDVPVIHLDIRQTPSPTNPLGVKGIGSFRPWRRQWPSPMPSWMRSPAAASGT